MADPLVVERDRLLEALAANRAREDQDSAECIREHKRLRNQLAGVQADIALNMGDEKSYLAGMRLVAEFAKAHTESVIDDLTQQLAAAAEAVEALMHSQGVYERFMELD